MARGGNFSTTAAHPVVDACMNPFVVNHEVPALRCRCEQGLIGSITAAEIQRGLNAEEGGGSPFQGLVFWMITAQEPRSAGPDWYLTRQGLARGNAQFARIGEAQIIVGREIKATEAFQRATPPERRQASQIGL